MNKRQMEIYSNEWGEWYTKPTVKYGGWKMVASSYNKEYNEEEESLADSTPKLHGLERLWAKDLV